MTTNNSESNSKQFSEENTSEKAIHNNIKDIIEQLWYRAKLNSLAHKVSMYYFEEKDSNYYRLSILSSLASILCIILGYIFNKCPFLNISFTILSVFSAFYSLFYTIFGNHKRYGFITEEHKYLMNSYLYIAQRSREAKLSTKSNDELEILLDDLQRDFSLLKVRGLEPSNEHFKEAHKIYVEMKEDPISSKAQSFKYNEIHNGDTE